MTAIIEEVRLTHEECDTFTARTRIRVDQHSDELDRLIAEEHRKLAPLLGAGTRALEASDLTAAARSIADLQRAIDLHLTQEDRMYYPALWALRPELRGSLERFIEAHDRFRAELTRIEDSLDSTSLSENAVRFRSFAESFAAHEVHEEKFLRELNEASDPSEPTPEP